ncbi:MAG: CCA tRNA nucleotidyltransferase [Bacilli bacterium]|nr:CCA tRNA nucleotidyltransferase [Bacilli bacterium]
MKEIKLAKKIAQKVAEAGGVTYYVGGCVRDKLLGLDNKDIDIEVHNITPEVLSDILDSFGRRKLIGESFGIFMISGYDLDISMPRKEDKTGLLHQDFDITIDPFIGTYKAALRRDFTINALMENVLTGEIIDHFGGVNDLKNKIIRHVNDKTFCEDSLRVLRACQFASRFDFRIADETISLCKTIDITNLPKERIEGELKKALLKGKKPSIFFDYLKEMEKLDHWFYELTLLDKVRQNPTYHKEGSVYRHTMMVLDKGKELIDNVNKPYSFMLSCLCHDFGKIKATKEVDGVIKSINHENMGDELIVSFMKRFTNEKRVIRYVINMARNHMRPNICAKDNASIKATNRMFDDSINPNDLIYLSVADHLGQVNDLEYIDYLPFLLDRYQSYLDIMAKPYVTGKDLIALGLRPKRLYKEALEYAHKLRLSGVNKEETLAQVVKYFEEIKKKNNIDI